MPPRQPLHHQSTSVAGSAEVLMAVLEQSACAWPPLPHRPPLPPLTLPPLLGCHALVPLASSLCCPSSCACPSLRIPDVQALGASLRLPTAAGVAGGPRPMYRRPSPRSRLHPRPVCPGGAARALPRCRSGRRPSSSSECLLQRSVLAWRYPPVSSASEGRSACRPPRITAAPASAEAAALQPPELQPLRQQQRERAG